ncbi:MAG: DUF4405 domain-containing protein [Saprospiraceae bacterium]|nr:DUF4405 domain-containing protein [Saprospiraceae bacterium]
MKSKQVISLSIAFAFLALSLTGILLYIKQKTHEIEITHTVFGLCFIGFAIFHIINNWGSIRGYSYEKLKSAWSKEIKIVGIAFVVLLVGGASGLLEPVAELGRIFASSRPRMEDLNFNKISTNGTLDQGSTWSISLEMDRSGFSRSWLYGLRTAVVNFWKISLCQLKSLCPKKKAISMMLN